MLLGPGKEMALAELPQRHHHREKIAPLSAIDTRRSECFRLRQNGIAHACLQFDKRGNA
jgi:hypothetical protein